MKNLETVLRARQACPSEFGVFRRDLLVRSDCRRDVLVTSARKGCGFDGNPWARQACPSISLMV